MSRTKGKTFQASAMTQGEAELGIPKAVDKSPSMKQGGSGTRCRAL